MVTMFQTLRIKFYISSSSSTHFISQCLFSILCPNPRLMFVLPRRAVHWKQKLLSLLFRVELLAVILPVRKNPDLWGSERHVASVNRKAIGEASEKTQQYIKILCSKVHQVFLSNSNPLPPTPSQGQVWPRHISESAGENERLYRVEEQQKNWKNKQI